MATNSNAHPYAWQRGVGVNREDRTMAGNQNSGRIAAPPAPPDALSEALVDAMAELTAMHLARKKFEQSQRAREHRLAALLRDAWNHHGSTTHTGIAA